MCKPNIPERSQIQPSSLLVIKPTNDIQHIVETLSTTQCLDSELFTQPTSPQAKEFQACFESLKELLASNPSVHHFAHFIAATKLKKRLADESQQDIALQRLHVLLHNPQYWDVVFFTNWQEKTPSEKRSAFHLDGERFGDLRIGMSNQKQTVFRVGPHDWTPHSTGCNCPEPTKDIHGNNLTTVVQPPAGSLVLWDTRRSIHRSPNISKEELSAYGRARHFGTASIGFDRMLDLAMTR